MKNYLDFLYDAEPDILRQLETFIRQETPTTAKKELDETAEWLLHLFKDLTGGEGHILHNPSGGNHVLCSFGSGHEQILLVGHFDTVHPIGTLEQNPWRKDGLMLFGPGIYDMKCGLLQAIWAVAALAKVGQCGGKRIVCLFNGDEEIGSPDSRKYWPELATASKYAFVTEPSFGPYGAIKIARKGVGTYKLQVRGKAAHAGNCPEDGANAIVELAHQVLKLDDLNDYARGISVNCGVVKGGKSKNTIPDEAELLVDTRAMTRHDSERLDYVIKNLSVKNPNCIIEVSGGFSRLPMEETATSRALYNKAATLWREASLLPQWPKMAGNELPARAVGGASDGNNLSQFTTVLDGLGAVGQGAHALDEGVRSDLIVPRTALLAKLLEIS